MLWDSLSTLPVSAYIPLILVFAATVAILGTFSGVGGGVLHIPVMVWVLTEIDLKEIKFISTILVFASALINTAIAMYKKEINYWIMIVAVVVATPTIFLGNYINNLINSGITEIIIVILLSYVTIQLIINQYVFKKRSVEKICNAVDTIFISKKMANSSMVFSCVLLLWLPEWWLHWPEWVVVWF
jgi:uncharacterized membrane protein YfcA